MNKDKKPEDDVVIDSSEFDNADKLRPHADTRGTNEGLDDSVLAEEGAHETVKKLREKLKKSTAEKQEYLDGWQRARADYTNFKKISEKERGEFISLANEGLIDELVPILESFEMAWANKEAWEKVDKNWRAGIEHIHNQFLSTLESRGMKILNPVGETFDSNTHEATEHVSVDKEKDNHKIISVQQKGYSLNGKILRPAKVVVGEFKK